MSRFLIYALVDPRHGKARYIGKSCSGMKRPDSHAKPGTLRRDTNPAKKRWIEELAALGLKYEIVILEELTEFAGLNERERWFIAEARRLGTTLLNMTDGGDGTIGHRHSAKARAAMSTARKGKSYGPHSPETKAKMSETRKGRVQSTETRARISAARKGRSYKGTPRRRGIVPSPGSRAKMSEAQKGKVRSPETRARMSAGQKARRAAERIHNE